MELPLWPALACTSFFLTVFFFFFFLCICSSVDVEVNFVPVPCHLCSPFAANHEKAIIHVHVVLLLLLTEEEKEKEGCCARLQKSTTTTTTILHSWFQWCCSVVWFISSVHFWRSSRREERREGTALIANYPVSAPNSCDNLSTDDLFTAQFTFTTTNTTATAITTTSISTTIADPNLSECLWLLLLMLLLWCLLMMIRWSRWWSSTTCPFPHPFHSFLMRRRLVIFGKLICNFSLLRRRWLRRRFLMALSHSLICCSIYKLCRQFVASCVFAGCTLLERDLDSKVSCSSWSSFYSTGDVVAAVVFHWGYPCGKKGGAKKEGRKEKRGKLL